MEEIKITHNREPGAAFIGGGFMAAVHSRAARNAGARLAGGASSSEARAADAASRFGFERSFASVTAMVQDATIDVVHVCSPNFTHAEYALAAITGGKNVICEKPLATTSVEAEELVAAAAEAGITATVPFVYRFHPQVREARARVASGSLGKVQSIHGIYLQDWLVDADADDWRVDSALGGPSRAFADIGSHLVDLLEFVSGDRIVRLCATLRTTHPERAGRTNVITEDIAALVIEMAGGAIGTLLISQVAPGRKNSLVLELSGTDNSVRFDQENPETLWLGGVDASLTVSRDSTRMHPDAARLALVPAGHPMGYQDAFNAFVADSYAAACGASPEGLPTFADGLRAVQITEAVLASAAQNSWVDVVPAPLNPRGEL